MKRSILRALLFIVVVSVIIVACGTFFDEVNPVEQPASVRAGDTLTITLHTYYTINEDLKQVHNIVAVLVPKVWKAAANTTASFITTIADGPQKMQLMAPAEVAANTGGKTWSNAIVEKYGIGPNVINDMEWIIFKSVNGYDVNNNQDPEVDVTIKIKTGPEALQFKPGYFISESRNGIDAEGKHYKAIFTDCLSVTEGTGDLVDFCYPQIGFSEPSGSTKEDIVSLKYDGGLDASLLKDEPEIYLCATAFTTEGRSVTVCEADDKTKLNAFDLKKWRKDIWPARYFNISEDQDLDRVEYYFTNKSGTLKTGYGNTEAPFIHRFKCN